MARLLHRMGTFAHRRPRWIIAVWLVVLLAIGAGAGAAGNSLTDDFTIPGSESQSAIDTLDAEFPSANGASVQIVLTAPAGSSVTDPDRQSAVATSLAAVSEVAQVASVVGPQATRAISSDGTVALAQAQLSVAAHEVDPATVPAISAAMAPAEAAGLTVTLGGTAFSGELPAGHAAEVIGLLIAVVVMAITLGSLLAAGLPLLTTLVGVGITLFGVWLASNVVTISTTGPTLALMLGLAVGIDYALFIVMRHRTELARGATIREGIATATATAGSAVVFAGTTVVIALLGLAVARVPFLAMMGVAAAAGVAVAVLVALTLVPALLAVAGERLRPKDGTPAARRAQIQSQAHPASQPWAERYVRRVIAHPVLVLVSGVAALLVLAAPVTGLALALPDAGSAPASSSQRQAYDTLARAFGPGTNGPLLVLADISGSTQPESAATAITATLTATPGVTRVSAPRMSADGSYALLQVIPATAPSAPETADVVRGIRDQSAAITAATGATVEVTGVTAVGIDVSDRLSASIVPFAAVVVGLSLLLLLLVFRSVAVPLKAAAGYLLSLGATLGASVAVFQWGWAADLVGVSTPAPLLSFMPIIVMAVLFGLAMDYEVFLVSRIHEAVVEGDDPIDAISVGARYAGRVVVAAAVIMIGVFGSFLLGGSATIKVIGFALAFGIFIDAFVVRLTLVPAALRLLGSHAWWLPAWLDRRLPRVNIDGVVLEQAPEQAPEPQPTA